MAGLGRPEARASLPMPHPHNSKPCQGFRCLNNPKAACSADAGTAGLLRLANRVRGAAEMKMVAAEELTIEIKDAAPVSARLIRPTGACACFVFAHGAGAGMTHSFMDA